MAEEVVALHERRDGAILERDRDDAVGRLQVIGAVVLQDREHPPSRRIDAQVREPEAGLDSSGRGVAPSGLDAHQVAVRELGVDDEAVADRPRATAVLVHPGAHVRRRRA